MKEELKNKVSIVFNLTEPNQIFDLGELYQDSKDDFEGEFNNFLWNHGEFKKLCKDDEIKIQVKDAEVENRINEQFKTVVGKSTKRGPITFAEFSGERLLHKSKKLVYAKEDQKEYYEKLLEKRDELGLINKIKDNIIQEDHLKDLYDYLNSPNNELKEKIIGKESSNWDKDNIYLKCIQTITTYAIKDELIELLKKDESSKIEATFKIENSYYYNFFKDSKYSLLSFTLSFENLDEYYLDKLISKLKEKYSTLLSNACLFGSYLEIFNEENYVQVNSIEVAKVEKDDLYKLYKSLDKSNYFIETRNKYDEEYDDEIDPYTSKVEEFILAIAYKNYYQKKEYELADLTLNQQEIKFDDIVDFASKYAKFQSNFIYDNPTNIKIYKTFSNSLDLNDYKERLSFKIKSLVKFIQLEHEKIQQENDKKQKKLEDKKTTFLTVVAIVFTFFGGFGAYPEKLSILTFSVFASIGILVIVIFGIKYKYNNSDFPKIDYNNQEVK